MFCLLGFKAYRKKNSPWKSQGLYTVLADMLFIAMVVVIIGVPVWKVTSDVFAVLAAVVFTIFIYWRPMNFGGVMLWPP